MLVIVAVNDSRYLPRCHCASAHTHTHTQSAPLTLSPTLAAAAAFALKMKRNELLNYARDLTLISLVTHRATLSSLSLFLLRYALSLRIPACALTAHT